MSLKRKLASLVVCGCLSISLLGCGGVEEKKITVQSSAIVDSVRKTLEQYAETGQTGSSMTSLESDINGIKASDSAKGAALAKDYLELQQATTPAQIKAKAKEMLGKL